MRSCAAAPSRSRWRRCAVPLRAPKPWPGGEVVDKDPWAWAGHIYASYAITALVLVALVAWLVWDGRRQQRRLESLEARGIRRRADE